MNTLNELYRETVLEHNKNPRNVGVIEHSSHSATGNNPLCGDDVEIYVDVKNGFIESVAWTGRGCAVSTASTSILTEIIKGMTVADALSCIDHFLISMKSTDEPFSSDRIDSAIALRGVKEFPVRIKCALLGWKTAQAALMAQHETVTTELK